MRFINKTTICAALGLLLLYIIRKSKTADEHPVSNDDDAPEYANVSEATPVASVTSAAPPPVDVTAEVAPLADSAHDTQADTDVAEHPDLSLYEAAFEQEDAAIDEPPPAGDTHDTQADADAMAHPDLSLDDDAVKQENTALDEPPSASEVAPKPKSPISPQRRRSPQPQPKHQRRPAARTQSKREYRPPGYNGRRIPTGVYYPPIAPPTERASLRCRETAGEWEIYLALPQERTVVKVTHDGDDLDYLQASSETELPLSRFAGDVVVHYQDDTADRITLLNAADGDPLLFKMQENWEGEGKLVGNPTAGHVLAIAPLYYTGEWDADEPHYPEECVDENFEARFLFLEGTALGRPAPMAIEGTTLQDDADADTEYHGKLYIGAPPELQVDHQITVARIVEETGVRELNKWGENFNPHRQSIASVLDGREGKFSIRTYHDGNLQESKPFRYFPALRRITLNGETHSPDNTLLPDKRAGEHREIALRFEKDDGDVLRPESVIPDEVHVADDGAVIVPPSPSIQTLTCDFPNQASIAVAIPRVWWQLTDEDGATGGWGSETHEFSRSEFMNLTKARIEIRTPPAIKAVEIGFGDETMNEFKASQGAVEFGLMGFVYYKDVFDALDKTLHLNIRVNGQTAPIARVLADEAPDESTANKALLNLLDMHRARAMLSVPSHDLPLSNTAGWTSGAHDVRLDRMKRPEILKAGSSVFGDVVQIAQGSHLLLEIIGESGELFRGILPWDQMATMTETERAEIIAGQKLPVYVIEAPGASPTGRARLSVDKLADADYSAGE